MSVEAKKNDNNMKSAGHSAQGIAFSWNMASHYNAFTAPTRPEA